MKSSQHIKSTKGDLGKDWKTTVSWEVKDIILPGMEVIYGPDTKSGRKYVQTTYLKKKQYHIKSNKNNSI